MWKQIVHKISSLFSDWYRLLGQPKTRKKALVRENYYFAMRTKFRFILAITIILFRTLFAQGQQTVIFLISDSITNNPISYARVININKSFGTLSDEKGQAILTKTDYSDSILISIIGYYDKKINCSKGEEHIRLSPKTYVLREAVVTATNSRISSKIKATGSLCNYYDRGYQIVSFVEGQSKFEKIEKISIFIKKKIKSSGSIRLRFYEADPNGMPGENLLPKSIIINGEGAQGWIKFDVDELNLTLPANGGFVGIEFLDFIGDNREAICVGLSDHSSTIKTWIQSLGGEWHQLPFMKNKSGRPFNIMVKVE